jgi:hypothetical protein
MPAAHMPAAHMPAAMATPSVASSSFDRLTGNQHASRDDG